MPLAHDLSPTIAASMKNPDPQAAKQSLPYRIWHLYYDGFKSMTVGKQLWAIIIAKAIVFFLILKLFFFPNVLKESYDNDADRANAVRQHLTTKN